MYYFDNAATTYPKPSEVYDFADSFYRSTGVNVSRGQYKEASIAANLVSETRELLLNLLHCNSSKDVVFTPSATIAINTILNGIKWKDGDIVYITCFEHNAVRRTLNHIAETININIRHLKPNKKTLEYNLEEIACEFNLNKPKYLILNHASNVFGLITPIEDIIKLAKKYNAVSIVDMAQTAGLIDTNLITAQVDYAIFAGHKTLYAPFGIAGFVIDKTSALPPYIYGGNGVESMSLRMPEQIPERFESGSLNIYAIAGLNAALKWLKNTGINNIRDKEIETTESLLKILRAYSNISLIKTNNINNQIGIISCTFDSYSSDSIGKILSDQNIAVRTGIHCSPDAHDFLGTSPAGTVRFSVSYFTSQEDLFVLKNALDYIYNNL